MKRTPIILMLFAMMAVTSCEKCIEYDYSPIYIEISATDAEGNDLFDQGFKDNVLNQNITFTYCDSTYEVDITTAIYYQTRTYLAVRHQPSLFYGQNLNYYVKIGEWAGDQKWDNEPIVINWPDGTHNTITFTLKKAGITHAKYYLDGQEHKGNKFSLVHDLRCKEEKCAEK